MLNSRSSALRTVCTQLLQASESIATSLTCYSCLNIVKDAVLCEPCGHVLCHGCLCDASSCPQCNDAVAQVIRVHMVDEVAAKASYQRQLIIAASDWQFA